MQNGERKEVTNLREAAKGRRGHNFETGYAIHESCSSIDNLGTIEAPR